MCAVGAPSFNGECNIVALETFSKSRLQRVLQFLLQRRAALAGGVAAAVEAKHSGAARAFEVPMLMLRSMDKISMAPVFGAGTIAEHPVIVRNLVRQSGIGQALKRAVQGHAIHVGQRFLYVLMRKRTVRIQQRRQYPDSRRGDSYRRPAQLGFGERFNLFEVALSAGDLSLDFRHDVIVAIVCRLCRTLQLSCKMSIAQLVQHQAFEIFPLREVSKLRMVDACRQTAQDVRIDTGVGRCSDNDFLE
jgi:hypothetical protein